jgi:hypothetical protein
MRPEIPQAGFGCAPMRRFVPAMTIEGDPEVEEQ